MNKKGKKRKVSDGGERSRILLGSSIAPQLVIEGGVRKPLRIRHETTITPNACRWCGNESRAHGVSYARSVGLHKFEKPTSQQMKARMVARRKLAHEGITR